MRKNVLITGIGGDISQSVATILRECRPDLCLIGVDMHNQHGGKLFVDSIETIPSSYDHDYISVLKNMVDKYSVDFLIPMTEPELRVLYPFNNLFPGAKLITAGARTVKAGLDKLSTINFLKHLGLPVPWTVQVGLGTPTSYPCILKNRYGSGSRNVFQIESLSDAEYFASRYPDAIFQELLEPPEREITCAVYRRRDGEVMTLLMLRRLTGGFTGWARVICNDDISNMCKLIAEGLNLRGSMNIQLILTDKGPRVFEINPRFSSTVLMRHQIGFSDVLWAVKEAEGGIVSFPKIDINKTMVRVQAAAIFESEEIETLE